MTFHNAEMCSYCLFGDADRRDTYYNEIEPFAAQWLENLGAAGHIGAGVVDRRSIVNVEPADLVHFKRAHFFAGIGVWDYALRLAGWPNVESGGTVWTGSCPCQPFSAAGKRKGLTDERHLWPEWFRLIRECRPGVILGEQVASADVVGKSLQGVQTSKTSRLLSQTQQGGAPRDLPRLREPAGSGNKTVAVREEAEISSPTARDASRVCISKRRTAARQNEGSSVFSGLEEHPEANRRGNVRSDGTPIRPDDTTCLECAVAGSACSECGVYAGEHARCLVCAEHDGERLGRGVDSYVGAGDPKETVARRIGRFIPTIGGSPEGADRGTWLDTVFADLEGIGYTCGAVVLAACSIGSPHIRQRLYWMAHANEARRSEQRCGGIPIDGDASSRNDADGRGALCGMGDASSAGLAQRERDSGVQRETVGAHAGQAALGGSDPRGPVNGFWRDAVWVPCLDGKLRPLEPGVAALAPRAAGRVGRVRAYGNAINAEQAAAFVRAVMAVLGVE